MEYYIQRGYLPAAVRNYLCLLGWSPKNDCEKLDLDEIIRIFDLKNIGRSSAKFDPDKLHWLNGEYARELSDQKFYELAVARLKSSGVELDNFPEQYVRAALQTCKGRSTRSTNCQLIADSTSLMILITILRAQRSISLLKTNRGLKPFGIP